MWQAETFMGEEQDAALAQMLEWLNEHEDVIVEFQTCQAHQPDGTQVFVVSYRARRMDPHPFMA